VCDVTPSDRLVQLMLALKHLHGMHILHRCVLGPPHLRAFMGPRGNRVSSVLEAISRRSRLSLQRVHTSRNLTAQPLTGGGAWG